MLRPTTVEKLFFIGLLVFWLLILGAQHILPEGRSLFSSVSLLGLLLGSFFSLANFRSWRLFLLGFLGAKLESGSPDAGEGGPKLFYLMQAIVLKTLVVLSVVVLILSEDPLDLPGFILSFSCYLLFGLFLTVIKAVQMRKTPIKTET